MKHDETQQPRTVERVVGRLIEMRVNRLDSIEEVQRFSAAIQKLGAATPDAVMLVDLRAPNVFPPPVTSAVITLMTRANKVRRKTAILLAGDHAVFSLQFGGLARQVGDPQRRTFTDAEALLAWSADSASEAEIRRAKEFIATREAPPPAR